MTSLGRCVDEASCLIVNDAMSAHDIERTVGSLAWRWRWSTLGLPAEAEAVVAPHLAETAALLGAAEPRPDALLPAAHAIEDPSRMTEVWHATEHIWSEAGRALAAAGFIEPQTGVVDGLFAGEGLPKPSVPRAAVWRRGLRGDVQRNRIHHGRPSQALCVWSADVVDALVAEGHPIAPGAAGENVSVRGVDWAKVRPGSRLRLGGVDCEISGWALPCAKNRRWFEPPPGAKKGELRMDPDRHPGWSRAYAYVLVGATLDAEATIQVGDPVAFT